MSDDDEVDRVHGDDAHPEDAGRPAEAGVPDHGDRPAAGGRLGDDRPDDQADEDDQSDDDDRAGDHDRAGGRADDDEQSDDDNQAGGDDRAGDQADDDDEQSGGHDRAGGRADDDDEQSDDHRPHDQTGDERPNDDRAGDQTDDEQTDDDARRPGGDAPVVGGDAPARRRWPVVAAAAAVALAVAGVAAWREPPPPPEGLVILYGDSLSLEASAGFVDEMGRSTRAELLLRPVPGESPCDALDDMRADVALAPDVVVIQFVGNNATECVRGPDGEELTGQALADRFEADVRTATELFATQGTRVVLVGGPHAPGLPGKASRAITEAYLEIANEWAGRDLGRVRYADAAATVTGDDHTFAARLPCREDEGPEAGCEDGEVTVRNPDRIHFCPVHHDQLVCSVPSPGARRFGEEMARVAAMALDPAW